MLCPITKKELDETNSKEVFDTEGNKVLVHKDVETRKCKICGKEHVILDECTMYLIYDNDEKDLICLECQKKYKYVICQQCGGWTLKSETKKDCDGYTVCKTCIETKYVKCEDCGKLVCIDNTTDTSYGTKVCNKCKRNYKQCAHCGKLVKEQDMQETADGVYYCDSCFETQTRVCSDCGRRFSRNNYSGRTSRDADGNEIYYCSACQEAHIAVHSYGYKPSAKFKKNSKDNSDVKEFFGSEIEVSGSQSYAEQFINTVNKTTEECIYLKNDASIVHGGFEIVTQPMTRNYIYDKFSEKLEKGLEYLNNNDFKGHNMGGIHIHVSKDALSNKQVAGMIKLLYTTEDNVKSFWLTLTQRKEENLRWGKIDANTLEFGKSKLMEKILNNQFDWKNNYLDRNRDRYSAMNCSPNNKTVEFRIFNSSTRVERILKNYEIVFSLIDFTNTNTEVTHKNYVQFVVDNKDKYKYLYEFLLEKELVVNDEVQLAWSEAA